MATDVTTDYDLDFLNADFEHRDAMDIVAWGVEQFGEDTAVSSSFGADSAVMLHLCTSVKPDIKVIAVNTGFLFPETLAFLESLRVRLNLNLHVYRPVLRRVHFLDVHGKMWQSSPDACCAMNKREPFDRAKRELGIKAWFTGIRREQSATRKSSPIIQQDHMGLIKLSPIANWTSRDVHYYLQENDLPYHPLREQGYLSIGCHPEDGYCTTKVKPGEDPRSGRWAGFDKTECGLHVHESGGGI